MRVSRVGKKNQFLELQLQKRPCFQWDSESSSLKSASEWKGCVGCSSNLFLLSVVKGFLKSLSHCKTKRQILAWMQKLIRIAWGNCIRLLGHVWYGYHSFLRGSILGISHKNVIGGDLIVHIAVGEISWSERFCMSPAISLCYLSNKQLCSVETHYWQKCLHSVSLPMSFIIEVNICSVK